MASTKLDIPAINRTDFVLIINSLMKKMTTNQWELLQSGQPDDTTVFMFIDMLLEMITLMSRAILRAQTGTREEISEEEVRTSLGDSISWSFTEALKLEDQGLDQTQSLEELTDLIAVEVAENVNTSLAMNNKQTEEPTLCRVLPFQALQKMIAHTCTVFKAFPASIRRLCKPLQCWSTRGQTISVQTKDQEEVESADADESSVSSAESLTSSPKVSSHANIKSDTSDHIESIIYEEISPILEHVLDNVPDSECELIRSDLSLAIRNVAEEIVRSVIEKAAADDDEEDEAQQPQEETTGCFQRLAQVMKVIFTKNFVRAYFHGILAQLKAKFPRKSKVESREEISTLMDSLESLLLIEDHQIKGKEVCVLPKLEYTSPKRVLRFIQQLCGLLYQHMVRELVPDTTPHPRARRSRKIGATFSTAAVAKLDAVMYSDIQAKVVNFLSAAGYWLNTKATKIADKVALGFGCLSAKAQLSIIEGTTPEGTTPEAIEIPQPEISERPDTPETPEEPVSTTSGPSETEKKATLFSLLMARLVTRIFKKSKIPWFLENPSDTICRLSSAVWSQLESQNFTMEAKVLEKLDKAIFKDLCKEFGSARRIMAEMNLMTPELVNLIATSFINNMKPPAPGLILRFCSAIMSVISAMNPCTVPYYVVV